MEDQYGMGDLRQYMNGRPLFHATQHSSQDLCLNPSHPYELVFRLDNTNHNNNNSSSAAATTSAHHHHRHLTTVHGNNNSISDGGNNNNAGSSHHVLESVNTGGADNNLGNRNNNNNGRWPRQETLTLLEIRSRLDSKFKEANQKGPLWDELSRIMSEEHGYQRSGKKCREKFENLYKYYKKTKEGKAGRQDGKHYRFFRQLEALYGDAAHRNSTNSISGDHFVSGSFHYNTPPLASNQEKSQLHNKLSDTSLSLSNYSESDGTTSSEDQHNDLDAEENDPTRKQRRNKKSWRVKIKDFIDAQMKKLMDKQEAWMERMVKTIERNERERMIREEEWRKQDASRIEREHKFWAKERAWIEARDLALMDALHKISGSKDRDQFVIGADIRSLSEHHNDDGSETKNNNNNNAVMKGYNIWPECEISRLIQLRHAMEVKFQQGLASDDVLWEEIASKMAGFGHDRNGLMCKDKWDSVNNYAIKCNKKRKENSSSSSKSCTDAYYHNQGVRSSAYCGGSNEEQRVDHVMRLNEYLGNNDDNAGNSAIESFFTYFTGDAYGRMMG